MKKGHSFRGYVLVLLAVSVLWMGCPQSTDDPGPGPGPGPGLPVPRNVRAEPLPENQLKVSWNLVEGATRYQVVNAEGEPQEATASPVILPGIGEIFSVKVRAGNDEDVWSDWSAPVVPKVLKEAVWGAPLKNYVYIEVNNQDPRVALNYELETGEKFFDTVIIFAANLRVRNCANSSAADRETHTCTRNGPHLHYNNNVKHILENRDKYIRPLQDAGIKVLLGLLGDHDFFGYHSLGSWPFESVTPWATNTAGQDYHSTWYSGEKTQYPFNQSVRQAFVDELVGEIKKYGLDGYDLDDEYCGYEESTARGLNLDYRTYGNTPEVKAAIAKNIAEFVYLTREGLGPDAIISLYDYRHMALLAPSNLPDGATFTTKNGEEPMANFWNYATLSGYSMYSNIGDNRLSTGAPNSQYSPFAVKISTRQTPVSYEVYKNAALNSDPYGYVLFFDLISVATQQQSGNWTSTNVTRWLSDIHGKNFYNRRVVFTGRDYPKDW